MGSFKNIRNVLWIRVGALGDLLISMAALEETCKQFPQSEVFVLGSQLFKELLHSKQWPQVKKIYVLENPKNKEAQLWMRGPEGLWTNTFELIKLADLYKQVDVVVNHRPESLRFAWGPWFARVPVRIGSCPGFYRFLFTRWLPWMGKDPKIHERDYHLLLATAPPTTWSISSFSHLKTVEDVFKKLDFSAFRNWVLQSRALLEVWKQRGLPRLHPETPPSAVASENLVSKKYVLVNPTSSRREKAWASENFKSLCEKLETHFKENKLNFEILVCGTPKETSWLKEVAGARFRMLQSESLAQLIPVIEHARLLVTNTSSLQFIAASTQTPVLTLMGRADPVIWGPLGAHSQYIQGTYLPTGNIFEEEVLAYKSLEVEKAFGEVLAMLN